GDTVVVTFARDGRTETAKAVLARSEEGRAILGVEVSTEHVRFGPLGAAIESFRWVGLMFSAVGDFFKPATFRYAINSATSVVGISVTVAEAVKNGPINYASLVALLSMALGVMNILPIPPLDGGKIAMELVEKMLGKPIERRVSLAASAAGAMLLFTLIGYLMYADIVRLATG
ncbi:MAG: site-2 protease family protein, partial [Actinomycetota bacterium]|nr:site-2 protease family protein [Actinomycetota bacterium]